MKEEPFGNDKWFLTEMGLVLEKGRLYSVKVHIASFTGGTFSHTLKHQTLHTVRNFLTRIRKGACFYPVQVADKKFTLYRVVGIEVEETGEEMRAAKEIPSSSGLVVSRELKDGVVVYTSHDKPGGVGSVEQSRVALPTVGGVEKGDPSPLPFGTGEGDSPDQWPARQAGFD